MSRPDEGGRELERRGEQVLPRFSLDRRVSVLVLLAALLVVGVVAVLLIPLELFPRGFDEPHLTARVPWPDAPAQEVIDKVILPLEEELSTVRGLEDLISFARTGYGHVFLSFKRNTDMDVAYREVRDRIERARSRLPDDVERVILTKEDVSGFPVMMFGVAVDPDLADVYNLIQYEIVRPIQRIDGVASVDVRGLEEKEILIELDRSATEAAGLNIYQLAEQLAGDNFTLASGHVETGGKKLLLRSVARYPSLEALEQRPVAPGIRLADIATVSYQEPERRWLVRAYSRPAYAVMVLKEGQANTIELTRRLREEIEEMNRDPRLAAVGIEIFLDQGEVIRESLGTLLDSGRIGGLFAIGVLFFFLRRVRMTLIITLSIPLSLLIGLTVMYFVGETLNILSLLGLMISIGLLVDNSVVVAENIFRLHREGLARRQAAIRGAGEMSLAVVMATLTTVAVFLPVSLVDGDGRFFLQRLSIPISVSLLASLLVALVFVPLAVYLTLGNGSGGSGDRGRWPAARRLHERLNGTLRWAYEASFGRLNRAYGRLLAVSLVRRLDVVIVLLVALGSVFWLFGSERVRMVAVQEDERPGFELDLEFPRNTTLEQSAAYMLRAEKVLEDLQEELGLDGYLVVAWATGGELQGWFANPRTTDLTPREASERLRDALPERAGTKFYFGDENEADEDESATTHAFTLAGEDPAQLETVADGLVDVFTQVPGVLGVKKVEDESPSELALVIDRDRAQRQGVNPSVVAGVVGYALRGQTLPRYSYEGNEIPVRVRFREEDRNSLGQLRDFAVPTDGGSSVRVGSLTDVSYLDAARSIRRRNKQIAHRITFELAAEDEEATRERLIALAAAIDLPEGVRFAAGEERQGPNEDLVAMGLAALLSVVFIYLLMGFLFESFILPLSVLFTIPLASIGVAWIHFATGKSLDVLGVVGGVLLIGVVVNNGIVLVDYVNRLREEGAERRAAILTAADRRFRPIMMTALTTICGMVPLTLGGATSIGLSYTSFGLTLIGGMTTATLLTLLVVPIFYTFFDDARIAVAGVLAGSGRARRAGTPDPAAAP